MEELYSSQFMFYTLNKDFVSYVQSRITFDEPVNHEQMLQALTKTIERYPYFKVKLVRIEERYCLDDNEKPLLLYDDPEHPTMEPQANNEYLLRVSAKDCLLNVCFCHALADGRGILPFIKTLLYYYSLNHYQTDPLIPDVHLAGEIIPQEEIDDPFLAFDISSITIPQTQKKQESAFCFADRTDPENRLFVHEFSMNSIQFMEYAHRVDGSPNSLFVLFLCKALAKLYPEHLNDIVISVALDERKALGVQKSHHSTVGIIPIRYSTRMAELPFAKAETIIRGRIIVGSDDDILKPQFAQTKMFAEYVRRIGTLAEKKSLCSKTITGAMVSYTGSVSYPRQEDYGKMNTHMQSFYIFTNCVVPSLEIEITSYASRFFIALQLGFDDDRIADELKHQIEDAGLECLDYKKEVIPNVPFRNME